MRALVIVSASQRDLQDACHSARMGNLVDGWGPQRDVSDDKTRFAVTVMVKGNPEDFKDYIKQAWNNSIRIA